ncbi:MAG TPA: hypothetical protein VFV86_03165, partial [Nitrososphaeraceae archaeon]|nr:hypothetical protein [Nitrososphaeraceae archaeon]
MLIDQITGIFTPDTIKEIKNDLYYLIRRYCKSYQISDFRYELYLHDSTRIEYIKLQIVEIERLISIVYKYWSIFPYLISNLSYDEERKSLELKDRVLGPIDFGKTIMTRTNQQSNFVVICTINIKNMFTPENILLASVILGISLVASKFLKAGKENQIEEFKPEHKSNLEKIIEYMQFLLKDRFLKKLVDYYLLNYDNNEKIIFKVDQRLNQGKLPNRYFNLIRFVRDWKNLKWSLNERLLFFKDALIPILDSISDDKLYELWIFYKILSLFEPVYQHKYNNIFVNKRTKLSIEYHREKTIGWQVQKNNGNNYFVKRYPDVVISKNGVDVCIIDAKCM